MNESVRSSIVAAAYIEAVRRRLGSPFWRLPKQYKPHLSAVANRAKELKLSIAKYVETQFEQMPKEWCLKTFKLAYPPLPVLASKRAYERGIAAAEQERIDGSKTKE